MRPAGSHMRGIATQPSRAGASCDMMLHGIAVVRVPLMLSRREKCSGPEALQ
ncbi:hypothetical protein BCR37DRAFT_377820 [Protomyces lactucae-debilis]|uniref:Uncharacterized protein n=1 Tax=Protomyces lactucae-debilis TaxID=2754530 RepID=A0A1Y2FLR7_PROLT|nr:uncharacterized protein BCR37DRAFT_377820 [Protomyces lactucae-debilis]ORY84910.1 hypothetical protein BCR37DRAFT_377820 [Protomyces lactucae-debilis]